MKPTLAETVGHVTLLALYHTFLCNGVNLMLGMLSALVINIVSHSALSHSTLSTSDIL
jgi:hypothetical protein